MYRTKLLWLLVLFFMVSSCEEVFEYHPNAIILEEDERDLTHKNLQRLKQQAPGDTIKLLLMGDTQRFYDHIEDFYSSASKQKNIDFMLHCGDISDFGMAQEFKWVHSLLKGLPFPYLTVIGNHDLLANGKKVYEQMYGPLNYYFDYGNLRFVITDTNSREYNYNGSVPNISWISSALKTPDSIEQAIVVSHIPPFDGDFDQSLVPAYLRTLRENKKVKLSLHGHQHRSSIEQPYGDDLKFIVTNSMKGRSYYIIDIWKGGHRVQEILY